MQFTFNAKNFKYSDTLKDSIVKKLGRLEKFFRSDAEAHVFVKGEKKELTTEVTVHSGGLMIRAEEVHPEVLTAIDRIYAALERQVRKYKTRIEKRLKEGAYSGDNFEDVDHVPEEVDFEIIKTKKIDNKPMTTEEAILQMNLLGHAFYMFYDLDNNINVAYKRKDGGYGIIEA